MLKFQYRQHNTTTMGSSLNLTLLITKYILKRGGIYNFSNANACI